MDGGSAGRQIDREMKGRTAGWTISNQYCSIFIGDNNSETVQGVITLHQC